MAQFDEERATYTANGARVDISTKIAGEDLTNDVLKIRDNATYTNISASALIKTGAGVLKGIVVNSHSSGTLKLWDNTAGSGTVIFNTITFAAGPNFIKLPAVEFSTGLYATIGGTADITILWK
jgi:hypothetical protein